MKEPLSEPNLRVLESSRRRLQAGDLFVMRFEEDLHVFGRIVSTEAWAGWSMPKAILIYVYDTKSPTLEPPPRADLRRDRLLVPPMMTNRLGWSRGYFQTVAHWPLEPGDTFERHCFDDFRGTCYDEFTNKLPRCVEPCGDWGLHSFRTIDDAVSEALGIPLVPD
jgi:hypothetical protein